MQAVGEQRFTETRITLCNAVFGLVILFYVHRNISATPSENTNTCPLVQKQLSFDIFFVVILLPLKQRALQGGFIISQEALRVFLLLGLIMSKFFRAARASYCPRTCGALVLFTHALQTVKFSYA